MDEILFKWDSNLSIFGCSHYSFTLIPQCCTPDLTFILSCTIRKNILNETQIDNPLKKFHWSSLIASGTVAGSDGSSICCLLVLSKPWPQVVRSLFRKKTKHSWRADRFDSSVSRSTERTILTNPTNPAALVWSSQSYDGLPHYLSHLLRMSKHRWWMKADYVNLLCY